MLINLQDVFITSTLCVKTFKVFQFGVQSFIRGRIQLDFKKGLKQNVVISSSCVDPTGCLVLFHLFAVKHDVEFSLLLVSFTSSTKSELYI